MGKKVGLELADIIDAATAVGDRDGYDDLTLAATAENLGVRSPSLYNHIDGLVGLRREVSLRGAQKMSEFMTSAAHGRSGEDAVRSLCYELRRFATECPTSPNDADRPSVVSTRSRWAR